MSPTIMAIDGELKHSIAVDNNGPRYTPHTIYGGRQWRSMDAQQCKIYCGGHHLLTAVSPVYCHAYNVHKLFKNQLQCNNPRRVTAIPSTIVLPIPGTHVITCTSYQVTAMSACYIVIGQNECMVYRDHVILHTLGTWYPYKKSNIGGGGIDKYQALCKKYLIVAIRLQHRWTKQNRQRDSNTPIK